MSHPEIPVKVMKNAHYFTLKPSFVLKNYLNLNLNSI